MCRQLFSAVSVGLRRFPQTRATSISAAFLDLEQVGAVFALAHPVDEIESQCQGQYREDDWNVLCRGFQQCDGAVLSEADGYVADDAEAECASQNDGGEELPYLHLKNAGAEDQQLER